MSRDPDGRVNLCEHCRRNTELYHSRDLDAYLCDDCLSAAVGEKCDGVMKPPGIYHEASGEFRCTSCVENEAEAAYERHQAWLMEHGPGPTLLEQQAEARKLK